MEVWRPDVVFDRDLVVVGLDANGPGEVIRVLSDKLAARGFVADDFAEAVIEREREFPTGLPTAVPVALPHTATVRCLRSALAVGVLRRPVEFGEMGNPMNTLKARVVFLLALANPKEQVRWLQRFMRGLRDAGLLERLTRAPSDAEAAALVRRMLELEPSRCGDAAPGAGPGDGEPGGTGDRGGPTVDAKEETA